MKISKLLTTNRLFSKAHYLTDGGLETSMIFHEGIPLNHFASFELLKDEAGRHALKRYFIPYLDIAAKYHLPVVIETPTWRANPDWGHKLGYSINEIKAFNKQAVGFMRSLIHEYGKLAEVVLLSGNIGPRGDGYIAENLMTVEEATTYHAHQVQAFSLADADLVTALTINYSEEGIGIIQAAKAFHIPVVISYTLETNGLLPSGESLKDAIEKTDAATQDYAEHFMINCAHPEHFKHILAEEGDWKLRIKGIRANASTKSHSELDESETLDAGDKEELARGYLNLRHLLPDLRVVGGCCGTDHTHIMHIYQGFFQEDQAKVV